MTPQSLRHPQVRSRLSLTTVHQSRNMFPQSKEPPPAGRHDRNRDAMAG